MNQEIKEIVKQIYLEKNHLFYLEKCRKVLDEVEEIFNVINDQDIQVVEEYPNSDCYPSCIFIIELPVFTKANFTCLFSSKVMICKILPLFYIQHEFEIENEAEDKMSPILDGFGNQAYTKRQFIIHDKIKTLLFRKNYVELDFLSMNEVIGDLSFPKDVTLFGKQVTIEYALFHDLLSICHDNKSL